MHYSVNDRVAQLNPTEEVWSSKEFWITDEKEKLI